MTTYYCKNFNIMVLKGSLTSGLNPTANNVSCILINHYFSLSKRGYLKLDSRSLVFVLYIKKMHNLPFLLSFC